MVTPSAKQVYKSVIGSLPSLPLNFELSQSSAFYKKIRLTVDSMRVINYLFKCLVISTCTIFLLLK